MAIILNEKYDNKIFNFLIVFCFLFLLFSGCIEAKCNDVNKLQFVNDADIDDNNFKQISHSYVLKFKNVWLDYPMLNGKLIKIPIFRGEKGNVRISQLHKKQIDKGYSIIGALKFYAKKGELKKTILDCVNFYKGSLFKNIDARVPTIIAGEGTSLIIWYDFKYMGYPSSVMIGTSGGDSCKDYYRYIDDICVNENYGWFHFKILIGDKSPFVDQKDKIQEILNKLEK